MIGCGYKNKQGGWCGVQPCSKPALNCVYCGTYVCTYVEREKHQATIMLYENLFDEEKGYDRCGYCEQVPCALFGRLPKVFDTPGCWPCNKGLKQRYHPQCRIEYMDKRDKELQNA